MTAAALAAAYAYELNDHADMVAQAAKGAELALRAGNAPRAVELLKEAAAHVDLVGSCFSAALRRAEDAMPGGDRA